MKNYNNVQRLFRSFFIPAVTILVGASLSMGVSADEHKQFAQEFLDAIKLEPNIDNGRHLYKGCINCHGPEGWGSRSGAYPQIAGQLKSVIIKQLADFRAGNRDNPIMRAFSSQRALGGPQDIADIAGYIANLPMTDNNHKGPPLTSDNGKKIYEDLCATCHGKQGEGIEEDGTPLLYGQHYSYLKRQFDWIRLGLRRNADPKMTRQIQEITQADETDVLSYLAHIKPPAEKLAPADWQNPDYPHHRR